jgi:glycosyltransferase involved in cell wall biosynthesis
VAARVCLLTNEYPPDVGGVGTSAHRIANLLADCGLEMHVLHLDKAPEPRLLDEAVETTREGSVVVHRAQVGYPDGQASGTSEAAVLTRYNRDMFEIADALQRRHRFDALHGFFLYPAGYVAALVARQHGLRCLVSIRGNDVGKYMFDPLRAGFVASALRGAERVTSVATSLVAAADAGLAPIRDKARTILNSIDPDAPVAAPESELGLTAPVVGSAGLFRYKKGLVYLFKALAELRRSRELSTLLAGDFFDRREETVLRAQLAELGLDDTRVTGRLPGPQLRGHLPLFDVLAFPSLFAEGCPNTLLEAMLAGRAIVASRSGAIPELLTDGEDGLLVEPGSSAEIATAVGRLLDEPELRARLGAAARRRALQLHPDRERSDWLEVYADLGLLGERPPRAASAGGS